MKKSILVWPVLLFLVFFTGCKDPLLDFEWLLFEGEGSYSSAENQSYVKIDSRIAINQSTVNMNPSSEWDAHHFQSAVITGWECFLFDGDNITTAFFSNHIRTVHESIFVNESFSEQLQFLWVNIESKIPLQDDIFDGKNPDKIILRIEVIDSDKQTYIFEKTADFKFTRK